MKFYKKFKFNEIINHIEDRIWAKEVLKDGYNIVYEPKASVFHYHGLNHNNNLSRAEGVAKIIEKINEGNLTLNSALDTHNFFLLISFDEKIDIDVFNNRLSKLTEVFSDFKKISFKNQKVAQIGTGSSGIQIAPVVAKSAKLLTVFQRTPNYSVPARNKKLTNFIMLKQNRLSVLPVSLKEWDIICKMAQ